MRNTRCSLLLILMTLMTQAQHDQNKSHATETALPPLEKVGEGALLAREFIYPLDLKPAATAHASTLAETASGLVVAFFSGKHEGHSDVGIRVSRFQDNKWSWPQEVANGFQNDSLQYPTWNPVLFTPQNGPLTLYYKEGPNPREWWGMIKTSGDEGKTWSYPRKIGKDEKIGWLIGPVKNKPIQLDDGTLISPSSTETEEDGDIKWRIHFEISKDNGQSWEVAGPINDGEEFDAIQPSILHFPDGRLMMLARTRQDVLAQSWSEDQGRTWSPLQSAGLPNPNSGTDAITLQDGRHLLIYNHQVKKQGETGRNILNLALSSDGKNWTPVMTLENEAMKYGYAYPSIIQTRDGLVHATYTYNRVGVRHVIIDPKKL